MKLVDSKTNLDRKCFMIDPHCPNVLMFHYALRNKIINHELVKTAKLIIQVFFEISNLSIFFVYYISIIN